MKYMVLGVPKIPRSDCGPSSIGWMTATGIFVGPAAASTSLVSWTKAVCKTSTPRLTRRIRQRRKGDHRVNILRVLRNIPLGVFCFPAFSIYKHRGIRQYYRRSFRSTMVNDNHSSITTTTTTTTTTTSESASGPNCFKITHVAAGTFN